MTAESYNRRVNRDTSRIRWWPLPAIAAVVAALLARAWLWDDVIRQVRVLRSYAALLVGAVLLLLWLSFFSRLSRRARLSAWALLLLGAAACFGLFRYRGLTGDLEPIFEPRFGGRRVTPVSADAAHLGAPGRDFPQFLGPERNATIRGVSLDWEARPPRLVWRQEVGGGWSGFAVSGGVAITQEQQGEKEFVIARELGTGERRWSVLHGKTYVSAIAGDGPRATPTVTRDRVYALGSRGILMALEFESGDVLWTRDTLADEAVPKWGAAGSPLLVRELVVVAGGPEGSSLAAFSSEDGSPVWSAGDDPAAYASPALLSLDGEPQIVAFNAGSVSGHSPGTGAVLWSQPWPRQQPNVVQPLPLPGSQLLVSAGYGVGSKLFRISRVEGTWRSELVWETPRLKAKFTNMVAHRGLVYGLDDGVLVCLDPDTGKRRWKRGRYGHGQLLLVGDLLLVQAEAGEVVLVEPDPERLIELGRFTAIEGKVWNAPALAGSWLLVRNDREAAAFELPLEP
jgi:outer membrane protein assembly factor BamB